MKKWSLILLFFLSLSMQSHSRQWIVFFAKEGIFDGLIRQSFGHAYIALVWEDPQTKEKVLVDCFGYYPKGGIRSEGFFGYMDGEMRDDLNSMREDNFAVEISENELISCLILKKIWAQKKYCLVANNCMSFIKNYCSVISKLKIPKGLYILPSDFLEALRYRNKNLESKGELTTVIEVDPQYKKSRFEFLKTHKHALQDKFKNIK